jgi:hypothetical protein
MLSQLRFGRGVDNRLLKAAGFEYAYTSREAVTKLGEHLRLHPLLRDPSEPYRYEQEVEEFLRWSPHVRGAGQKTDPLSREQLAELQRLLGAYSATVEEAVTAQPPPPPQERPKPVEERPKPVERRPPVDHYDDLESEEVISLLGSLERPDLETLLQYEEEHAARDSVTHAIRSVLARAEAGARS